MREGGILRRAVFPVGYARLLTVESMLKLNGAFSLFCPLSNHTIFLLKKRQAFENQPRFHEFIANDLLIIKKFIVSSKDYYRVSILQFIQIDTKICKCQESSR